MRIGQIVKDAIYGAGGAVVTRVGASVAAGLVPSAFAGSQLTAPILQAGIAVTLVRWAGNKFFGKQQGDMMMIGGLVSSGLEFVNSYLPNIQTQLTGIIRAPIQVAQTVPQQLAAAGASPDTIAAAGAQLAGYRGGYGDVEEVPDSVFAGLRGGFGDVEDVPMGIFS